MIVLVRKWNGNFPSIASSKLNVWFGGSSSSLVTWILSWLRLTWGCRPSKGYIGEWEVCTEQCTYQWRCWTSRDLLRSAYETNKELFNSERKALDALTEELGLTMIESISPVTLNKDPAGMTPAELDQLINTQVENAKERI